jgi:hypothetical protein
LLLFLLATPACTTTVVACDFRGGSAHGAEPRCQERTGVARSGVIAACESLGADPVDLCPDDPVAACLLTGGINGREVVDWYYAPAVPEEVRSTCFAQGGEPLPLP